MDTAMEGSLLYVLENLSVPLRLHDGEGRVVYQNAAHLQLFGDCTGHFCHRSLRHADGRCRPCTLVTEGECVGEELLDDGRRVSVRAVRLREGEGHLFEVLRVQGVQPEYEAVESFVHTAAHDLKTPLVSIKGYADLLQRDLRHRPENERGKVFAERIVQQAQRMEGLLDELLAFARADTSGGEARDLDLGAAARAAWTSLLDQAEAVGAELELDPGLPAVRLSPVRLQQVLTNLFSNAIRYRSSDTRLQVTVRPYRPERSLPPNTTCIAVEDNGVGVREGDEERIFRLFHRGRRRGESDGEVDGEGSGIGLAIVKRIVDGAGGVVWVEAKLVGSRFVVCLPVAKGSA
ncbi:MAG TPA: HAMP domain-containing sensor histidine kinase [Deferrisomatales bacterium]|nr:HAMP domain-containing sensor histidine kinase [Deferrisomatales bacterium]